MVKDYFRYMRDIWIFGEEDRGFGFQGIPSGYLRIEVRQGKGKIYAMVQNLKETKPGQNYGLYLLKVKGNESKRVKIGSVNVSKGRGELIWEFDPGNVGGSNSDINDFNACALVVENGQDGSTNIQYRNIKCPLVAYRKEKVQWKDGFVNEYRVEDNIYLDLEKEEVAKKASMKEDDIKEANVKATNIKEANIKEADIRVATVEDTEKKDEPMENKKEEDGKSLIEKSLLEKQHIDKKLQEDEESDARSIEVSSTCKDNICDEDNVCQEDSICQEDNVCDEDNIKYIYDEQYIRKVLYQEASNETTINKETETNKERIEFSNEIIIDKENVFNEKENISDEKEHISDENDSASDEKESMSDEKENTSEEKDMERIETDTEENATHNYYIPKKVPNIIKLIRLLDKEFKRCDPFNSRRRDYRWWSINSPVNLVNVLEESGINVPNFFSPSVIMAYFKYRYLIAGIYISRKGKVFFVCGIPGTYNIDESPFGDMCRWVQVERKGKKYGAFGYWVTYIDPYSGELLKFS